MCLGNFVSGSHSVLSGNPEMSIGEAVFHTLSGVVFVHALHELVISLGLESVWHIYDVGVISTETVHPVWILLILWLLLFPVVISDSVDLFYGSDEGSNNINLKIKI
jgi:hypothetical protein